MDEAARSSPPSTALVLSGGGPLAVAWEAGLIAGLAKAGVRVADRADLLIGTSAGAIVGAQLRSGAEPGALAEAILAEARGVPPRGAMGPADPQALAALPALFLQAHSAADPAAARIEIGARAVAATVEPEAEYVVRMGLAIGTEAWPERDIACAAVDIGDGAVRLLDRGCGAGLDAAVAASCSLPGLSPPVTIAGRRYIDGGFGSTANADLAAGFARILVIAYRPPGPAGERIGARLERQLAGLRAGGAETLALLPGAASLAAIGSGGTDLRRRPQIAAAAIGEGEAEAEALARFLDAAMPSG